MGSSALIFLGILAFSTANNPGANSTYDPKTTDEIDDPKPDEATDEYPPIECDSPVELKEPSGAALVCPDPNSVLPEFKLSKIQPPDHSAVAIKYLLF